jgi:glycosyltransferase involved in cell wall biosynthesis
MVLPVQFYRVDENTVACESAFALHLKMLMPDVKKWADKLVILSPSMTDEYYQNNKNYFTHIKCEEECIDYIEAYPSNWGRLKYLASFPFSVFPTIYKAVKNASVIHSGPTNDPFNPFEIISIILGIFFKRNTLFFIDIDHRASTDMLYKTGKLSKKSYLLKKYFYDKLLHLQIKFAVKFCTLVILKSESMVNDYGKKLPHVKNFYDTAHDLSFVLNEEGIKRKLDNFDNNSNHIRLVYFGRLVEYKGIRDMMLAIKHLQEKLKDTGKILSFTLIGSGEQTKELEEYSNELGIVDIVEFKGAIEYGQKLFDELENYDFLLAAPNREDTPRSAFDSFSCGLPIIAYDTYYYKNLSNTGAVSTVPWLSYTEMANAILEIKQDSKKYHQMSKSGVDFARKNTQEYWLEKRFSWNEEFFNDLQNNS